MPINVRERESLSGKKGKKRISRGNGGRRVGEKNLEVVRRGFEVRKHCEKADKLGAGVPM